MPSSCSFIAFYCYSRFEAYNFKLVCTHSEQPGVGGCTHEDPGNPRYAPYPSPASARDRHLPTLRLSICWRSLSASWDRSGRTCGLLDKAKFEPKAGLSVRGGVCQRFLMSSVGNSPGGNTLMYRGGKTHAGRGSISATPLAITGWLLSWARIPRSCEANTGGSDGGLHHMTVTSPGVTCPWPRWYRRHVIKLHP